MTERHDLEPIVRDWLHNTLDAIPDPIHRYGLVASEVNETAQQRSWVPLPLPAQHTIWSTAKAIVAISIVALFGGFLLFGALATQEADEALPATVPEGSAFPTGTFVSEEGDLTLEFLPDGTCVRAGVACTYGVNRNLKGNLFSEMSFEDSSGSQAPATYYWDYDGERLTFELWGIDKRPDRQAVYADHAYRPVGETQPLPATDYGFPSGRFIATDGSGFQWTLGENGRYSATDGGNGYYAVNGDLITEMYFTATNVSLFPGTYHWNWDGKQLSFRLWGEDNNRWRTAQYLDHVYVKAEEPSGSMRRLLLSDPRLDIWVTVELTQRADGSYEATATVDGEPFGEGIGRTRREAVEAALEPLGEPYASDIADNVTG